MVVVVLATGGSAAPDVRPAGNAFLPGRGDLIRDRGRIEGAARAWKDAQDGHGVPDIDSGRPVEALWAGRAPGGRELAVLGQYGHAVLVRRSGGSWKVEAGAHRPSGFAPVTFGGKAVLLPGDSGSRVVSTLSAEEIGVSPDVLVDGLVLPGDPGGSVSRGFVAPDRRFGVLTAFGQATAASPTVSYKVTGPRDDTRIARLIRAGHKLAFFEALYPGDRGARGGGTGIGQMHVLADGRFGRLGHGVALWHSRNGPADTAVSVGFDDPDRTAVLLGTGEPPFATSDRRPLFGSTSLSDRGPFVIAGDPRIRGYELYRGAHRVPVRGPIAVLPGDARGVTAVIGHTAGGAPVLPVGG